MQTNEAVPVRSAYAQAQYQNMLQFGEKANWVDIHVDAGANRARRIVAELLKKQATAELSNS